MTEVDSVFRHYVGHCRLCEVYWKETTRKM